MDVALDEIVSFTKDDEGVALNESRTCVRDGDTLLVLLEVNVTANQPDADTLTVTLTLADGEVDKLSRELKEYVDVVVLLCVVE